MPTPPHILLIIDDQHRYDFLEMTGKYPVPTPNLARMAAEGVWHRQAYSPCPLCMPARASLLTGLYGHQHGLTTNMGDWPAGLPTLPRVLQAHGYHTAAIGKLHAFEGVPERLDLTTVREQVMAFGYDELHEVSGKALAYYLECEWTQHMRRQGLLDAYRQLQAAGRADQPFPFAEANYQDVYITDHVLDWLERYDDDRPFFLCAGLVSPHPPFDAPACWLPVDAVPPPVDNPDPAAWRAQRALYAGMVSLVDAQVGRMLAVLARRGLLDDTLILFVSDHGEMLGDHGLGGKCYPHDPSTRVPLLARYPALIPPGLQSDALVELTDLPATILHVALGADTPQPYLPGSPGQSLLPHWQGHPSRRAFVYSEDGGHFCPPFQMLRSAEWKYVYYPRDNSESLFHMPTDSDECHNRAADPACHARIDTMKTHLLHLLATTPPPPPRLPH